MKLFDWVKKRKLLLGFVIIVLAVLIYWFFFTGSAKASVTKYVMGTVATGSIISSVSGSGNMIAESQVDIKPQASGKIISLKIKEGDSVKSGQVLAVIDNSDALTSVKNAEISLQSAQLSLDKIKKPATDLNLTQARDQYNQAVRDLATLTKPAEQIDMDKAVNAVQDATRKLDQAKSDYQSQSISGEQALETAYNDAYNAVFNTVTSLHKYTDDMVDIYDDKSIDNGDYLYAIEYQLGLGNIQVFNFKTNLATAQQLLLKSNYQTISKPNDKTLIKQQLTDARTLAQSIYTALGSARILIKDLETLELKQFIWGPLIDKMNPIIDQDIVEVSNYLDTLDSSSRNLDLAIVNTPKDLQAAQDAVTAATANLQEQQDTLDKLKKGATPEDIASAQEKVQETLLSYQNLQNPDNSIDVANAQLNVTQQENNLASARKNLDDYSIKAPFDGKISTLDIRLGDTVSSGTTVATIISTQYQAEVSLNEVDVPKAKIGNKVTITLDAFPDDTFTGKVVSIDAVGTTSQGVVNYNAKITFDNIIDGIKPGMTVSANIITSVLQDILLVPSGAVKTSNGSSYVEYFDPLPATYDETTSTLSTADSPKTKDVVVGSSDDTNTEITSGVAEGDIVVVQTISTSASSAASRTATSSSALRIPGITGGGGFAGRPGG